MSYYDDKYKCHPCDRDGVGHRNGQTTDDDDQLAEQQSYTTLASFRNGSWEHLNRSNSYGAGTREYQPFFDNTSTPNQNYRGYSIGPSFANHMDYDKREVAPMPSLPAVDMTRNFYSPPSLNDSFQSTGMSDHQEVSASGSSESTSSTKSFDRPAPARSAFMMFSDAKRVEIMGRAAQGGKVRVFYFFPSSLTCISTCLFTKSI